MTPKGSIDPLIVRCSLSLTPTTPVFGCQGLPGYVSSFHLVWDRSVRTSELLLFKTQLNLYLTQQRFLECPLCVSTNSQIGTNQKRWVASLFL